MIGTFSNYNKTGYQNLSDKLKEEALEKGAVTIDDKYVPNQKLIQMPLSVRMQRAIETIKALENISGGAMQTNNLGDVTPKFIVLATTNTGNHPFSHVVKSRGDRDEFVVLNIAGLREIIEDYKNDFEGKIFIGKRNGFLDDENDSLTELASEYKDIVVYGPINKIIDAYCEQLKNQIS